MGGEGVVRRPAVRGGAKARIVLAVFAAVFALSAVSGLIVASVL